MARGLAGLIATHLYRAWFPNFLQRYPEPCARWGLRPSLLNHWSRPIPI